MTRAHTVTLRPNTHRQTQRSAHSTVATVVVIEEDGEELPGDATGTEHLDTFEEWEDEIDEETEDEQKRPAVRVLC